MRTRRRDLIKTGTDDAVAHRMEYFLPYVISLVGVCAPFTFIGYAFDGGSAWGDSVGAGIGLLVGLALWIVLLVAFIANGGAQPLRDRLGERSWLAQIESRRERDAPASHSLPDPERPTDTER